MPHLLDLNEFGKAKNCLEKSEMKRLTGKKSAWDSNTHIHRFYSISHFICLSEFSRKHDLLCLK